MKILITDRIADAGIEILKSSATVDVKTGLKPEEICSIIKDYEALIIRSQTKVTADVINAADRLQVIGRAGVGIDNIDLEAATIRGIYVVNSTQGNIVSTAEHAITMLCAAARSITKADSLLKSGVWNRNIKGIEIRNKILGVIGLGRVGTEVAQLAKGLHMNVIAYDPLVSETVADRLGITLVELDNLLASSDFITLHVPFNPRTKNLINKKQIDLMKSTAILINCARGGIVDEEALNEALNQGRIAGAAIDVFSKEPATENILIKNEKVIVTPHLAASTLEAEISTSIDIAEQIIAVLNGSPPRSPVNAPLIRSETVALLEPYMNVGKIIGKIASQLIKGQLNRIVIRYEGEIAKEDCEPIKFSTLGGVLETMTDDRINAVNVEAIAKRRGLKVTESKDNFCENYNNMITVELHTASGSTLVAGSSLRGRTYLTRIGEYWLEIEPSNSYLMITEHKDRPGMVGAVGTILGDSDVNISQMHVSRGVQRGGNAMMALCLDEPLSAECYNKILAIPDMGKVVIARVTV
jgi:D-3-phosphoglycerate dehydrogenase